MNSKNPRSRRHAPAKRSEPLSERLAAFQKSVSRQFRENQRQQKLRRQRQQRLQSKPAAEQRWVALRKALQFNWLQSRLQRRQQIRARQGPGRNPVAWFWPRIAETLSTRDAAARVLRSAAAALLLVSLITLVISAVPLRLTTVNWYLEVLALIGEALPVLVLACVFSLLSLTLDSDNQANMAYRGKLLRISRLGYILALLLLPLQLSLIAWLYGDTFNANRNQLNAILSSSEALIAGAQKVSTTEQFVTYLRSRNINANLQSIAAAPLAQIRTEFIRSVKAQQLQQEQNLAANNRSTLLRYTASGLRLFAALAILAAFMRGFQAILRRTYMQGLAINQPLDEERYQPPSIASGQLDSGFNSDKT
jgi:hypothetical protein